jgi:hypothetical protein
MTDDEIIDRVWGVMVLEQRLDDDPYSLSMDEIEILRDSENRKSIWRYARLWNVNKSLRCPFIFNFCHSLDGCFKVDSTRIEIIFLPVHAKPIIAKF